MFVMDNYDELYRKAQEGKITPRLRLEVAYARAEAWKTLLEQRAKMLHPKDASVNDLDRKTMMDAFCAEQERDYQLLDSLWTLLMH